jgi:hypothetical protein
MGMEFSKDKDYLRYEKNARNLFLHVVQEMQKFIERHGSRSIWNRLQYIEGNLNAVAGVPPSVSKTLEEAIASTKQMFGTHIHQVAGRDYPVIDDEAFDDAVRMVLLILEEMEK